MQKYIQKILISIILVTVLHQIYQAFATSDSLDMIGYRDENCGEFLPLIVNIHKDMLAFKLDSLLKGHALGGDFGYGWIFWMICSIFTIPGAIISHFFGIDNVFIGSFSLLSILITFGGLYFFYNALSFYTKDEIIKAGIILIILSFPSFGYFSVKWHPNSFNFFFNMLVFFFLAKIENVTKKDINIIAILSAASIASRPNGLFILPFVGLILADRLRWKINQSTLKITIRFLIILIIFSVLFYNPSLFLFWKKEYYIQQFKILAHITSLLTINSRGLEHANPALRIEQGFFQQFMNIYLLSFFVLLFLISPFYSDKKRKYDLLYIFIGLLIILTYLTFFVKFYIHYSFTPYLFTVSFFIPMSLIVLKKQNTYIKIIVILSIVVGNVYFRHKEFIQNYTRHRSHEKKHEKFLSGAINMRNTVGPLDKYPEGLNLLLDYRIPTFYNARLRQNVQLISVFDNINIAQNVLRKEFHYIGFFKESITFQGKQRVKEEIDKIKSKINNANISLSEKAKMLKEENTLFLNWMLTEEMIRDFLKDKKLKNSKYKKVYEDDLFIFFKKID